MLKKTINRLIMTLFLITSHLSFAEHHSATLIWETEAQLMQPENVILDEKRNRLYVSNVNGQPNDPNGQGFLSIVSTAGKIQQLQWVTGLNAPKGMAISEDTLYVSDINKLVAIDLNSGAITAQYLTESAIFLNDVVVDNQNRVYVSDMMGEAVYRLADGRFERWIHDASLQAPNGLIMFQDKLLVGGWGVLTEGFTTRIDGHLKTVDLKTKKITSLGNGQPVANIDGLEQISEDSFLVTDWVKGRLLRVDSDGTFEELLKLKQGSADIAYIPSEKLVLIPMMMDNTLRAYQLQE